MKRLASIFIVFLIGHVAYGQLIQGKVSNANDQSSIPYASVYISGTMVGTASDEEGRFELDVTQYASLPLVIRAIGYEAYTLKILPGQTEYHVALTPDRYEIEEVAVETKSLVRKRKANIRLFKSEFLGNTGNQRSCTILNEDDITFNYGNDKDTLKVFASVPLVVYNASLGYLITYFLDEFSYDKKRDVVTFIGDIVFKEDLSLKDHDKRSYYLKKREQAYIGSCMHFFRALWNNKLSFNGFSLNHSAEKSITATLPDLYKVEKALKYKDVVWLDSKGKKHLVYLGKISVTHRSQVSRITLLNYRALFEQNGFYDPVAIRWDGYMAEQRVADMLPYEYTLSNFRQSIISY